MIGAVGAGKTSLLNAIGGNLLFVPEQLVNQKPKRWSNAQLKDLALELASVDCSLHSPVVHEGAMTIAEQRAWIENKTIKQIILFGRPLDQKRYDETIQACQLHNDLAILPAADQTEIGEAGLNLSGGQKARVSLARAVYADSEILLLDDPISALDADVGKKVFHQVIKGICKHKTIILATHAVDYLHLAD